MHSPRSRATVLDSKLAGVASWLDAFDTADRPMAESLLRWMGVVSRTAFATWVETTIRSIAASSSSPIAVLAVREVGRDELLFPLEAQERPSAAPGSEVGSEGLVAHLLKSIARGDARVLAHPSVNMM